MRTESHKTITFHHALADIKIKPLRDIHPKALKNLIQLALDSYQQADTIPAQTIHNETKARQGDHDQTPGYYLKLYRTRRDLTQKQLAEQLDIKQHHLSEMEHNKRTIGKVLAKKIANALNFNYRKLL